MFTGIVEEVGRVGAVDARPGLTRLRITAERVLDGLQIGDSIAVNGACLTVVATAGGELAVEATPETLRRTNLGRLAAGDGVHLERPMAANGRFGGHIVQGHVDAVGQLLDRRPDGEAVILTVGAPPQIMRYVVPKGSIAVDGVSLTVVDVADASFTIALIPHTQEATLLCTGPPGRTVNLEADVLAKYVERVATYAPAVRPGPGTAQADNG
jgi:riboflavin synthase